MSISIIKPGILDTVQDMGRYGYGSLGINCGGAMDRHAAALGNMLVGNAAEDAVLEMHFPGPQILFEQNALISITGADFNASLNDELLPRWTPLLVRKNTILHFPKWQWGSRTYLALHGGICADNWLGSYSTNLKAIAGGFRGRKLDKGDELTTRESLIYFPALLHPAKDLRKLRWTASTGDVYANPEIIRFVRGHEFSWLEESSQSAFLNERFVIHPFSDRMGYRLQGPRLNVSTRHELVSSGVSFGTLQVLPNGELIVLMADHQTTGGYPRPGHVITADLPKLAQLRPGQPVRFAEVSIDEAERRYFERHREIDILRSACAEKLNELVCHG